MESQWGMDHFPPLLPWLSPFFSQPQTFPKPHLCVQKVLNWNTVQEMLSRGINNRQSGGISFLKSKIIPECTIGEGVAAAGASLDQGWMDVVVLGSGFITKIKGQNLPQKWCRDL